MEEELIPVQKKDFLEEDPSIRNQNFYCVSFISPEDVLKEKDAFYFHKFLESFSQDMNNMFNTLIEKYPDDKTVFDAVKDNNSHLFKFEDMNEQFNFFKNKNEEEIEKEFHSKQNFKTTVRGLKVRGVYDTMDEAKKRCDVLKKIDPNFNIMIGQVGCWCPWSPNPNDIDDQNWSETQLNTLMMNYKKNKESKDELFNERTQVSVSSAKTFEDISSNVDTKN